MNIRSNVESKKPQVFPLKLHWDIISDYVACLCRTKFIALKLETENDFRFFPFFNVYSTIPIAFSEQSLQRFINLSCSCSHRLFQAGAKRDNRQSNQRYRENDFGTGNFLAKFLATRAWYTRPFNNLFGCRKCTIFAMDFCIENGLVHGSQQPQIPKSFVFFAQSLKLRASTARRRNTRGQVSCSKKSTVFPRHF